MDIKYRARQQENRWRNREKKFVRGFGHFFASISSASRGILHGFTGTLFTFLKETSWVEPPSLQ
jgi:hypothetical protein